MKKREPIMFGSSWCIDDVKHLFREEISHMKDDKFDCVIIKKEK